MVSDFLKNEGPELDARLRRYASERDSYIEAFWDAAYLDTTESVVLNLNPFFVLEDDPTPSRGSQMQRAVGLIMASLGFVHDLRTGQLEPDAMRGTPLDMYQYSRLFGTARIPTAYVSPVGVTLDCADRSMAAAPAVRCSLMIIQSTSSYYVVDNSTTSMYWTRNTGPL